MTEEKVYSEADVREQLAAPLTQWRQEDGMLCRTYRTGGWKASMMVANAVAHLAEAAWHHPDIIASYPSVTVKLTTHSAGGITDKDLALARKIEEVICWRPGEEGGPLEGTPDDPRYTYLKDD
jgi:pterin-4a-carbinolamine dehydratase